MRMDQVFLFGTSCLIPELFKIFHLLCSSEDNPNLGVSVACI